MTFFKTVPPSQTSLSLFFNICGPSVWRIVWGFFLAIYIVLKKYRKFHQIHAVFFMYRYTGFMYVTLTQAWTSVEKTDEVFWKKQLFLIIFADLCGANLLFTSTISNYVKMYVL